MEILAEGYPARLDEMHPYSDDPIEECMNRCLNAYPGSELSIQDLGPDVAVQVERVRRGDKARHYTSLIKS